MLKSFHLSIFIDRGVEKTEMYCYKTKREEQGWKMTEVRFYLVSSTFFVLSIVYMLV